MMAEEGGAIREVAAYPAPSSEKDEKETAVIRQIVISTA